MSIMLALIVSWPIAMAYVYCLRGRARYVVRIAATKLLRNAAENTYEGALNITLAEGMLCIRDSGSGFDPAEASQRFMQPQRLAKVCSGGWSWAASDTTYLRELQLSPSDRFDADARHLGEYSLRHSRATGRNRSPTVTDLNHPGTKLPGAHLC